MIIVRIIGNKDTEAYLYTERIINKAGCDLYNNHPYCDLFVAPLLTERLTDKQIQIPKYGVLVFHPSPLPYGRGASAIKYAYERREPITAATWFWANSGAIDSGNICEQEIIKIDYDLRPRDFYRQHILPSLGRTLERALRNIDKGIIRSIPQISDYASFDYKKNTG